MAKIGHIKASILISKSDPTLFVSTSLRKRKPIRRGTFWLNMELIDQRTYLFQDFEGDCGVWIYKGIHMMSDALICHLTGAQMGEDGGVDGGAEVWRWVAAAMKHAKDLKSPRHGITRTHLV